MVRTEGADKRTTARFLAYGVNGLSVALMVVVFAHTAGLTGAEVGHRRRRAPCSGRSCSRRSSATRPCARSPSRPGASSRSGSRALLDEERRRYLDLLASLGIDPEAAERLRNAARAVDDLRLRRVERGTPAAPERHHVGLETAPPWLGRTQHHEGEE